MKILYLNVKKKNKFKTIIVNCVIIFTLLTVFAFSYAGGALQVFSSGNKNDAIYQGNTNNNNISLMVNVYWGDEYLPQMLDVFNAQNVKVTFFVGGVWASKNEVMLRKMLEYGHELGNHGYVHKDQDKISAQANYDEINQTHQIVKGLVNYEMNLFAPPSGAYNQTTLDIAEQLGYKTIMWSKDTIDWRDKDANLIYERATKNVSNGDLILMHPTEKTLEALPNIINYCQSAGFNLTTVSETLK